MPMTTHPTIMRIPVLVLLFTLGGIAAAVNSTLNLSLVSGE